MAPYTHQFCDTQNTCSFYLHLAPASWTLTTLFWIFAHLVLKLHGVGWVAFHET